MAEKDSTRKTVAVVGSGMAGLVSAYLLTNDRRRRFDVEIFEIQDHLSLDSASYTIPNEDHGNSKEERVDLPMRTFAAGYYPNLMRMYEYLGIRFESTRFVYSISDLPKSKTEEVSPRFIHTSNNHRMPPLRPEGSSLWAWLLEASYLLICYLWLTFCCFFIKPRSSGVLSEQESLGEYFARIRLPQYYVKNYFLPMMCSLSTCTHDTLLNFPAVDLVDYAARTWIQPHYHVSEGVREAQARISGKQRVKYGAKVTEVKETGSRVQVSWTNEHDGQTHAETFDYVIMAVTPDVVGAIFQPLQKAMAAVPTVPVQSIVHRDYARLPRSNEYLKEQIQLDPTAEPIYIRSDSTASELIQEYPSALITTFPVASINPEKILHRAHFTRVLRTPKSREVVNHIFNNIPSRSSPDEKIWQSGDGNVFLVGGWCWDGMVLLEGCIESAMRVAQSLDVEVPWRT